MKVLNVRNVHEALPIALDLMQREGIKRDSRNGGVYQHPEPVATVYSNPCERVIFHPWRDANPFFHFYESLWMLAGRRDIASLTRYVKRMASFSDDGETQNAAYGYRWRHAPVFEPHWGGPVGGEEDQLDLIIAGLQKNKDCRRQVLQIWDHARDLGVQTKDAACNIAVTFQVNHDGKLDMTVFCRSNDIIWGCYGANAVHFSVLMEYIATSVGVPMGRYTQISVNWHAYEDHAFLEHHSQEEDPGPYEYEPVYAFPLMSTPREQWDLDCATFTSNGGSINPNWDQEKFSDPFFRDVAYPIVMAHDFFKDPFRPKGYFEPIYHWLSKCEASDWRLACTEWMQRRWKEGK
jgi:hypothetical protein